MFSQPIQRSVLSLILVAGCATSASGSWFGDWFLEASWFGGDNHEELATPQPEFDAPMPLEPMPLEPLPTLEPPYQSHRFLEEGEIAFPDAGELHLPPPAAPESVLEGGLDIWGDEPFRDGATAFDPPYPSELKAPLGCCEQPIIRYWNHPLIGMVFGQSDGGEEQYAILELEGECCPIEVPVWIPECCVGAPECETRDGLWGRTTHEYCWPSGYRVKIVRWGQGDLIVHTYNPLDVHSFPCVSSLSRGRLISL